LDAVADPVTAFLTATVGQVFQQVVGQFVVEGMRRPRDREVTRRLESAVRDLSGRLAGWRQGELAGLPEHEWQAAVQAVRDALRAAAPLDVATVVSADGEPARFAELVRSRASRVPAAAGLGAGGTAAYERLLGAACEQLARTLRELPAFGALAQSRLLGEVRDLDAAVRALPDRLDGAGAEDAAHREFTARYRDQVVGALGTVEIFGLSRGRAPARHPLDTAYVPQAVARAVADDEHDAELTGAGTGVLNAFADTRRALVRGGAGAGKTTLLRWLALRTARTGGTDGDREEVPFLVPLRRFPDAELPPPERLPDVLAAVIAAEAPPRWVARLLRAGAAWILIDGVDELAPDRREAAGRWLEQLVHAYPLARYVVTTRPSAVAEDWLAGSGFVPFDLLAMTANSTREFVRGWHDAARADAGDDEVTRRWLDRCESGLADLLATGPELRRLAAVPLLCALLCALYQDGNMHLPRDRKGLYEAALDLLLVRWDEQRRVQTDGPGLSKEEQTVLLQRFAYSLIKNAEVQVSRDLAVRRIGHAMRGLRSYQADPEPIVQYLLERTGLLREPHPDVVQFVHRTFRDYLAAKEVVDSGDLAHLIDHAHLDSWHDVVVMAVAHARPHEREALLRKLLDGNAAARRDRTVADRLHLVAAACLEQADVTATGEVRTLVERAAARLIPPDNADDAELLAKAGRFVLDLLPDPHGLTEAQAAAVVRTVALIGGEAARDKIARFAAVDEAVVIDELLRAWRQADDPEEYARDVLAEVNFGERRLDVRGWHRVQHLRHIGRLTNVRCLGDLRPLDPLAEIPNLTILELVQNEVVRDLSPLVSARRLRELRLAHCSMLRDLGPLTRCSLTRLALHFVPADLSTLARAPIGALTIRAPALAGGLWPIPADLPLTSLTVDNAEQSRDLAGIARWPTLEHLTITGAPTPAEVAELSRLPALRRLTLRRPRAADLRALSALPRAYRIDLHDARTPELPAILATLPHLTFTLDGHPHHPEACADPAS
jgi:NACHT conflict system protein/NACHT domain-containing protein